MKVNVQNSCSDMIACRQKTCVYIILCYRANSVLNFCTQVNYFVRTKFVTLLETFRFSAKHDT